MGQEAKLDLEILVVDDGSKDNSREILEGLKSVYPELRTVFHEANRGYGERSGTGIENARGELVFYTDGDGQYDVPSCAGSCPRCRKASTSW